MVDFKKENERGCLIDIIIIGGILLISVSIDAIEGGYFVYLLLGVIAIVSIFFAINYGSDNKDKQKKIDELRQSERQLRMGLTNKEGENKKLRQQLEKYKEAIKSTTPFTYTTTMVSDLIYAVLKDAQNYLIYKPHPGFTSHQVVDDLKKKYRELQKENLLMKYKYEYLYNIYPELRQYVDEEEGLISLSNTTSISQVQEEYDRVRDYISNEEYRKLSENQRNQLALDRYKEKRRTSSWVAGVEYEMFASHHLRERGYRVIENGAQRGLEDLGRDIIATKGAYTYIIQCKRYGEQKLVHENTICQLYGTTLHYIITQKQEDLFAADYVVPILVTTTKLSSTAKEFALKLGVKVQILQMGEYPMIKCNINNGNKIYHLPFDQQYWHTKIDKPGEFYAYTVEEATQKGFRRAFKYNFRG